MTDCDRFDAAEFTRWERGESPDEHTLSCGECLARWRALERIVVGLGDALPIEAPSPDWKARVLAALSEGPPVSRRTYRLFWSIPMAGVAAAAFILLLRTSPPEEAPALEVAVIPAAERRFRSQPAEDSPSGTRQAVIGDHLKLHSLVGPVSRFELRVFRGDALVFRCPPGCGIHAGRLEVDLPLTEPGRYDAFLAVSGRTLPEPAADRHADLTRIRAAGGRVGEAISVEVK